MKTSALKCLTFAALSAGGLTSLATASHAMMTADEFLASLDDMKRVCHRIEEPLWVKKRNYGCGQIVCAGGHCVAKKKRRVVIILRPENPHLTPTPRRPIIPVENPIYPFGEPKSGGSDGGSSGGGGGSSGGGDGRGGSSLGSGPR